MNGDSCDILRVIDTRMVSTLQLQSTNFKHLFHAPYGWLAPLDGAHLREVICLLALVKHMNGESFLEIDPSAQVVWNEELFLLGLSYEMISIKVTTRHKNEFFAEHTLLAQEHVQLLQRFLDGNAAVDLILGYSGQFGAKIG